MSHSGEHDVHDVDLTFTDLVLERVLLRLLESEVQGDDDLLYDLVVERLLQEKKKKKVDYKDAYRRWHSSKKAKRARAQRNKIRRQYERAGKVRKGDGKEIDHIVPKSKGGSDSPKNLRVVSRHTNRTKGSKMPKRKKD